MKCAVMQPTYLPWLGFFDLIRSVDIFVIYDHVQFEKQSWQQRNKIRNKQGEIMLTVSVMHDKGLNRRVKDVRIDNTRNILAKHLTSIKLAYSRSKNFDIIYPDLEFIFQKKNEFLIDLNVDLIKTGMKHLHINKNILFSSEMSIEGSKVEALIDVCKKTGANQYLSPVGSKVYIDENNLFPIHNIELHYQSFTPPVYQQLKCNDFISHLSFVDYLFNIDIAEANNFGASQTTY